MRLRCLGIRHFNEFIHDQPKEWFIKHFSKGADAFATAIGNVVKGEGDIEKGLGLARGEPGIKGAVIIVDERMGLCGDIRIK